ncbi:TMEM175 family protein [Sphingomonas psychrotolerans]|uniref:TMEM175 family protein n=1 Tax=Sphingomonas psychrotolerans TaxID=1327635 RepID=A0ABU3N2S6_9SPHN|nr:TMEM175 family protein [Sphingomonas psychrotolerans]MDT8758850.1 TMEM175 family protein [Sphingomonas psychrotolerans]
MGRTSREPELHGPGHALERLIFFSDAVFAIAITLLIIEIHVPEVHAPAGDREFLIALAQLIPNFISFFVSFFVIGSFWAGHHRVFDCARHWSPRIVLPNLVLLCTIAAMPFFTALSSEYYGHRVPVALYSGWMALAALAAIWLQRIVTSPPVVGENVPPEQRALLRLRGYATLLGATTSLIVALFVPVLGQPALITIVFWRLLLQRLNRRA